MSFYTAAVSAQQQQQRLDIHANNIANVNNYGFRARRPVFSTLMTSQMKGITEDLARGAGSRLESAEAFQDTRGLHETGRLLDFAINGSGFFALTDPQTGTYAFTRDGSFTLSEFKSMETPEPVPITQVVTLDDGTEIEVEIPGEPQAPQEVSHWYLSDGMGRFVLGRNGQALEVENPEAVDIYTPLDVGVFDFINYDGMKSTGDNDFNPVDKNGQVRVGEGNVVRGMLEDSNTDLAYELSKVIETQRSFSFLLKMVSVQDELASTVNGLR